MSKNAGALLWRRMSVFVPGGVVGALGAPGDTDTGLTQLNKDFANQSVGEPGFGSPSRIQVVPLAPTSVWNFVTHTEPVFDPTTETIHVLFSNSGPPVTVNVLFWDPHTAVGPGEADTYVADQGGGGPPREI